MCDLVRQRVLEIGKRHSLGVLTVHQGAANGDKRVRMGVQIGHFHVEIDFTSEPPIGPRRVRDLDTGTSCSSVRPIP
jgi:hypothetical protein